MTTDLNALVTLLEQEAVSWDLQICPNARHPDAINRNAHAERRADLLRQAAAAILALNTRAASGGLNEHFGKPEQFDVNEPSGDSGQLPSLEQRARELLAAEYERDGWPTGATRIRTGGMDSPFEGCAIRAITAALANQQGVGGWQPIETAPRDGTRIILGRPDCDGDGGVSVAGYWLEELEDGVDYMGNDGGFTDVDYQVFQPGRSFGAESFRHAGSQPTHWKHLPEPPTQPAGDVGSGNG